jgi:hypothetical protein
VRPAHTPYVIMQKFTSLGGSPSLVDHLEGR